MAPKNESVRESDDRDFVITRVFDAPPALVFKAWTDPAQMARWWGPHHFTNPVCEMDLRPGGAWRIVMRGPDGSEHPAKGVYREIVEPQRLVMTVNHSELSDEWHDRVNPNRDKSAPKPAIEGLTTVTFEDEGGKTRLTVRMRFESQAVRDSLLKLGMNEGWSQSLERLENVLTKTDDREIVISRVLDAPRELVWEAMTDPRHVIHWWGPRGFSTTIQEMDVRPGGVWKHVMHGPDGTDYPNSSVFTEIVKPQRVVFSHGGAKAGGPEASFIATWSFDSTDGGSKTKVTVRMVFPTAAQRDAVVKEYGAIEGGKQTLQRLSEYLPKMSEP
jgi:uncharacterized protein YndB with AHSA1/START domain